jgi:hypothetical protein
MPGIGNELPGVPGFDYPPVFHDQEPFGDLPQRRDVMGNKEHRHSPILCGIQDKLDELFSNMDVR